MIEEYAIVKPLVGQYLETYLPVIDGVVVTVQNYARWLNQENFSCYVATAAAERGYVDTEPYQVIRYRSVPVTMHPPYRVGIPWLDLQFLSEQQEVKPDLVHAHSPFSAGNEALRIARKLKIPLVASFHSKFYDDVLHATSSKFLAELVVGIVVDFYNKADYVWTVNQGTARTLRDYGYKKTIEIMPNGTDFIFPADLAAAREKINQRFGFDNEDKVMLFVGQHILQKNLMMLIEAAGCYARAGGKFKLLMVGEGYASQALAEKAAELGIADQVIFAGVERDRETLSAIYLRADLFTFPSVYDNAPLVVREAAMAKCPSIMIEGSNAAENAVDEVNAYLCQENMESLCQTIGRALGNDEKRHEVGLNASQTICQPWQEIVRGVADRYREILAEHKPRQRRTRRPKI